MTHAPSGGGGFLHLCSLVALPAALQSDCPSAPHQQPAVTASVAEDVTASLAAAARLLDSFPGPLAAGSSRDKVQKWLKERAERCGAEEGGALAGERVEALRTIWEGLRLLAKHGGHLRPPQSKWLRCGLLCCVGLCGITLFAVLSVFSLHNGMRWVPCVLFAVLHVLAS